MVDLDDVLMFDDLGVGSKVYWVVDWWWGGNEWFVRLGWKIGYWKFENVLCVCWCDCERCGYDVDCFFCCFWWWFCVWGEGFGLE